MQRLASLLKDGRMLGHSAPLGASPDLPGSSFPDMSQKQMSEGMSPVQMGRLHLCGQACRFSPFSDDLLAIATSQLFGMAGPGAIEVFMLKRTPEFVNLAQSSASTQPSGASSAEVHADPKEVIHPMRVAFLNNTESVNDVSWSELNAQTLVSGGGGGMIATWRLSDQPTADSGMPARRDVGGVCLGKLKGHTRDIISLSWSCVDKRFLTSAALDGQLKLWDMQKFAAVRILPHTSSAVSCFCSTSPVDATLVASVGADGRLAVHDIRSASVTDGQTVPSWSITAHPCEALCVDWVKHRPWQLLTGAADGTVALWDLRRGVGGSTESSNASTLEAVCRVSSTQAHQLAVRRVASHPFQAQRFASCSYDMQVKIWDSDEGTSISMPSTSDKPPLSNAGVPSPFPGSSGWVRLQACFDHHREFILGLDWSTFTSGRLASTSWDRSICVWNADTGPAPPLVPKRPLFLGMKTPK